MKGPELIGIAREELNREPAILFAYLFGSWAREKPGQLSDIDLAVFIDRRRNPFKYRLKLMEHLARSLKSENFDLIVLNDAPLLLQYEVVRVGKVLKERRSQRIAYEARVLRDYLDTEELRTVQRDMLRRTLLGV